MKLIKIFMLFMLFGLISSAFAISDINDLHKKTSVNGWDVAFESDYYQSYVTSKEMGTIPYKIDFEQKIHTIYFYVDNKNPTGFNTYQQISEDLNKSKVTLHLAGKDNGNAWIISPEDYDPRVPYKVNYNNNRRVVVKFEIPEGASKKDVFELGLRAKSLDGENKQILLNLVSEYPDSNSNDSGFDFMKILMVIGIIIIIIIVIMVVKHVMKKGGKF